MAAAISIVYRFYKTARFSPFATLSSRRTRYSILRRNLYVNTAYGSTEKTLMELSLFQIFINHKMRIQIRKSALSLSWIIESVKEVIESIQASQKTILITRISLRIIQHLNLWKNRLIERFRQNQAQQQLHQNPLSSLNLLLSLFY
jgi:hypothetical protein